MGIKNIIGELQVNGVPVVNKVELNEVYDKTVSKGQQLITNGNGVLGDNTNFSALTFDGAEAYNSPGSFTSSEKVLATTDEFMVIDPTKRYEFSLDAKSLNSTARMYAFVGCYDVDKQIIMDFNYVHILGSLTTLAQDLKPGDTTVYITDVSGWDTSIKTYGKLMIWNYINSFGYTYPSQTYTRNVYPITTNSDGSIILDATAKTVTLKSAYSGALVPAGTSISQGFTGGSYNYITLPNTTIPTTWTHFSDYLSGIDTNASRDRHKFPPGVAYTNVSFLWNWNSAADQVWMTNVSFRQVAADSDTTYTLSKVNNTITLTGSDGSTSSVTVPAALTLTDSVTSTSTTTAATPNSVKQAYDLASQAQTQSANAVSKTYTGVQSIAGGLVVGGTSATATGKGRIMVTGNTNPLIGLQAIDANGVQLTPYYLQVSDNILYLGPTSSKALTFDSEGNISTPAKITVGGDTGLNITSSGIAAYNYSFSLNNSGLTFEGTYETKYSSAGIAYTPVLGEATYSLSFPTKTGTIATTDDFPNYTVETWTFELEEGGSTVTKQVLIYS